MCTFFNRIVGNMVRTLNKLSKLRETKYGQPPPRHGLNLLWWFAHYCVQIDSNGRMTAQCNPENGEFGFHRFYNWDALLPKINLPYYEVGNLNNAGSLPYYVTENYTGHSDKSNKDRIIVSFESRWRRFMNVYVTQHSDQTNFDQNHTYCISVDLLKNIQDLSREEFLRGRTNRSEQLSISIPQSLKTTTRQGISNELMQDIQDLSLEEFHRGRTNRSEHISINIPQSLKTTTRQGISNELMQDIQDLSLEEFHRGRTNRSEQLSIPQSVQHSQTNTCQSWKCCALIGCGLLVLLIAGAAVYIWMNTK